MATGDEEIVYSHDRVRRLRLALRVALGVGVVVAALALWGLVVVLPDGGSGWPFPVLLLAAGAALVAAPAISLRRLPARDAAAKRASIVSGALLLPCSLLLGQLGFVLVVIGLAVLFLALIADDPEIGGAR
ncbi:hypothetical protein [Nocardioides sp. SYSU DS0663]|uniref:hypothetical protein n=1 Tax=Nocardioides sp. SYSU DS0663 TaxID=3416445 RepID=UPI003F4B3EFF